MSIKKMSDMTPEERYILQQACRHQMRVKLLADINADMMACQMEGWDQTEYIRELYELLDGFMDKINKRSLKGTELGDE